MKLVNFATGDVAGKSTYESCVDYQFFLILNIFCWSLKDNPQKRKYDIALLHIAKKNSKTVNCALIVILLMFLEPKYSEFRIGANKREQADILFSDVVKILESSPHLKKHFIIKRREIICSINKNVLKSISSDYNTSDGHRISAAVMDEVGAAKNGLLIESMRSSMLSVKNRLLVMISTSYPNLTNPFITQCEYAQNVLDGIIEDEKIFPMIYTLDKDDELIPDNFIKANPLQATLPDGKNFLEEEYYRTLAQGGDSLTSFYTKHLNKWVEGSVVERYVDMDKLRLCELKESFDWKGKKVYLGLDLSQTTDLTAVSMLHYEEETANIYAKVWGFLPTNTITRKSNKERVNYRDFIEKGYCFDCGDDVIDYAFVENFILTLEEKYGVRVIDLGFDRRDAISTVNKLTSGGIRCTEIPQHSRFLHSPIKLLEEKILDNKFFYEKNKLLELNFGNCRVQYDTNLRKYLHKKRSVNQMIDLVFATVNALKLLEDEEINKGGFFIQELI